MGKPEREFDDLTTCCRIIEACSYCHVALDDDGAPYLVPLNFGWQVTENQLTLYFHSAPTGYKIDVLRKNPQLCFNFTNRIGLKVGRNPCSHGTYYESVTGRGRAVFLADEAEKRQALDCIMAQQAGPGAYVYQEKMLQHVTVFRVVAEELTGKHCRQ